MGRPASYTNADARGNGCVMVIIQYKIGNVISLFSEKKIKIKNIYNTAMFTNNVLRGVCLPTPQSTIFHTPYGVHSTNNEIHTIDQI